MAQVQPLTCAMVWSSVMGNLRSALDCRDKHEDKRDVSRHTLHGVPHTTWRAQRDHPEARCHPHPPLRLPSPGA